MNYIVDIIDTKDNTHVLSLEKAERESITLDYKGADRADELNIVGSTLDFSMIYQGTNDGYYYDLFTGDETRFKVRLYDELDTTIWSGFLLPESYSEPYSHTQIVEFAATDGLGRLKGKYLPDAYYKDEQSVIDVIAQCLKLTGLTLDFRFSPAIENSQQKDYKLIYIDTAAFQKKEKKQDAYKILGDLLESMLCSVYQSENCFNIEGLNIRNLRVYTSKRYDVEGAFIEEVTITRDRKQVTGIATPSVSMHHPIGTLSVKREKDLFALPEGLHKENNDGWGYVTEGIVSPTRTEMNEKESVIYASDWFGRNGHYAYSGIDNTVFFSYASASHPIANQRIDLSYRPYVKAGQKYKLVYSFEINTISEDEGINQGHIDNGDWENPFDYDVAIYAYDPETYIRVVGNAIISTDPKYLPVNFGLGDDKISRIELNFIPERSGDFIFSIYPLKSAIGLITIDIKEVSLELVGDSEEILIEGQVAEDWTTKKEIDLVYGSDVNGAGFRLQKLREPNLMEEIQEKLIREFDYKDQHYISLTLSMANLVDENREEVYRFSDITGKVPLTILDVIYNYNNSNEHVALVANDLTVFNDDIIVNTYNYGYILEDRQYWEEWTDSVFKIERKTYEQSVYNVNERYLDIELPSFLGINVRNNIKFNDVIFFDWKDTKEWVITNLKWQIDTGYSEITMTERYYVSKGDYSPVVDAGDAYYTAQNTVQLYSEAYDPDGYIVKYFWEELTDNQGSIGWYNMQNPIFVLGENNYYAKLRVTVTDNDGNTASDEVEIYRRNDVQITFEKIFENVSGTHYKMIVTPELQENTALNIRGKIVGNMSWVTVNDNGTVYTSVYVKQNNIIQSQVYNSEQVTAGARGYKIQFKEFSINYIAGDEVIIELKAPSLLQTSTYVVSSTIKFADYIDGFGSVDVIDERIEFTRTDT